MYHQFSVLVYFLILYYAFKSTNLHY